MMSLQSRWPSHHFTRSSWVLGSLSRMVLVCGLFVLGTPIAQAAPTKEPLAVLLGNKANWKEYKRIYDGVPNALVRQRKRVSLHTYKVSASVARLKRLEKRVERLAGKALAGQAPQSRESAVVRELADLLRERIARYERIARGHRGRQSAVDWPDKLRTLLGRNGNFENLVRWWVPLDARDPWLEKNIFGDLRHSLASLEVLLKGSQKQISSRGTTSTQVARVNTKKSPEQNLSALYTSAKKRIKLLNELSVLVEHG